MERRILVADIGGTNSRFGHFSLSGNGPGAMGAGLFKRASVRLSTRGAGSFGDLLDQLGQAGLGLDPARADISVFAVPGAVKGRRIHFSNVPWELDQDAEAGRFGGRGLRCVNDFMAHALSCRTAAVATSELLLPGEVEPGGVVAAIGAGTGLGKGALVPIGPGRLTVVPSEGGHTALAFNTPEEQDYLRFVQEATGEGYARGDTVVSGPGLSLLHRYLTGEDLSPRQVSERIGPDSPTTALFARYYGRAARDYALTVLAAGGLFVCGGVAAKNPMLVRHPEFGREFLDSPRHRELLAAIPVRLMTDEESGLFGAALWAAQLLAGPVA